LFLLQWSGHPPDLHSFPTRRSSDLPKSHYAFTDQILVASTGAPTYTGDADRSPVLIPVPQAMMETGAEAAVGILGALAARDQGRSEEHTSELQSRENLVCRLLLEKK